MQKEILWSAPVSNSWECCLIALFVLQDITVAEMIALNKAEFMYSTHDFKEAGANYCVNLQNQAPTVQNLDKIHLFKLNVLTRVTPYVCI